MILNLFFQSLHISLSKNITIIIMIILLISHIQGQCHKFKIYFNEIHCKDRVLPEVPLLWTLKLSYIVAISMACIYKFAMMLIALRDHCDKFHGCFYEKRRTCKAWFILWHKHKHKEVHTCYLSISWHLLLRLMLCCSRFTQ